MPRALVPSTLEQLLLAPHGPLSRLVVVTRTGSTNDDVVAALRSDPDAWPDGSLLVAQDQTAGRGRADRTWLTPAGTSLTCTFVVHWAGGPTTLGWLPLLAGLACVRAVRATAGVPAWSKWPNDVLVRPAGAPALDGWGSARKVAGVLASAVPVPGGTAVAIGIGVNVHQAADQLPVPSATSLALAGARAVDRETLLVALVDSAAQLAGRWRAAGGDAHASGLADEVASVCATLGARVRVALPDRVLTGVATGLAPDGALLVDTDDGPTVPVRAGDVLGVRDEPAPGVA